MSKMKEIYESINWSKVPANIKGQFDELKEDTDNFSDAKIMDDKTGKETSLAEVYQDNFDSLVGILKAKHPEAMGGKAEPKKAEAKEKKAGKTAKAPKEKKAKKDKKAKKEKTPKGKKEEVMFNGKPLSQADCDELIKQYRERREQAKKSAKKSSTKSIFDKITDDMTDAVSKAVKSIPVEEIKKDPSGVADALEKIEDIKDDALSEIKKILEPYVNSSDLAVSSEAKKDEEALHNLISGIRKKYKK